MDELYNKLLALCARAYGAGMYADVGPDPEAARQLEKLLDATLSDQELADLDVVGWLPTWRRDFVDFILHAREMVGDEFGERDASGSRWLVDADDLPEIAETLGSKPG